MTSKASDAIRLSVGAAIGEAANREQFAATEGLR
jgi:hypothetical protein